MTDPDLSFCEDCGSNHPEDAPHDRDALKASASAQHARIDAACFPCCAPEPLQFRDSMAEANAIDRDLAALDRIAAVFTRKVEATNLEAILNGLNEIRAILRETGRKV